MNAKLKTPYALSIPVPVLMAVQAVLGLLYRDLYRDIEWIRATWFGNDLVTLLVAVPLMVLSLALVRTSVSGLLLWLGTLGYAFYNYAYYLFGTALNAFFPLYIALFLLSAITLILSLMGGIDPNAVMKYFRPRTPVRLIGGYLVFAGTGLSFIWFLMWGLYIFAGMPTPVEPEAFKLVAAIDTVILVPFLLSGGILLWRKAAWGFVLAGLAGIQSSLYLLVLTVNTVIPILKDPAKAPGELPIWGTLFFFTAIATILLLAGIGKTARKASRK